MTVNRRVDNAWPLHGFIPSPRALILVQPMPTPCDPWQNDGYFLVPSVLSHAEIETLLTRLDQAVASADCLDPHGIRLALMRFDWVRTLANSSSLLGLAQQIMGTQARPVKGIIFDKLPGANWKVPPHQDLTINVQRRLEAPGFGPWSIKAGIDHVQPPLEVMQSVVTLRLHLDDCPASNGALRVVPGSHRHGRLDQDRLIALRNQTGEVVCSASAGDVLVMSPLIIHSSAPAQQPGHRRVIHLEYSALDLPGGLEWREARI